MRMKSCHYLIASIFPSHVICQGYEICPVCLCLCVHLSALTICRHDVIWCHSMTSWKWWTWWKWWNWWKLVKKTGSLDKTHCIVRQHSGIFIIEYYRLRDKTRRLIDLHKMTVFSETWHFSLQWSWQCWQCCHLMPCYTSTRPPPAWDSRAIPGHIAMISTSHYTLSSFTTHTYSKYNSHSTSSPTTYNLHSQ